jgi:molybdopterin converting factor small subunit
VPVTVELTYDMAKALGVQRFEVETAGTVADVVRVARERFGERGELFDRLTSRAAVAVNGVLSSYRKGRKTRLADGDTVAFVKAAAGG